MRKNKKNRNISNAVNPWKGILREFQDDIELGDYSPNRSDTVESFHKRVITNLERLIVKLSEAPLDVRYKCRHYRGRIDNDYCDCTVQCAKFDDDDVSAECCRSCDDFRNSDWRYDRKSVKSIEKLLRSLHNMGKRGYVQKDVDPKKFVMHLRSDYIKVTEAELGVYDALEKACPRNDNAINGRI